LSLDRPPQQRLKKSAMPMVMSAWPQALEARCQRCFGLRKLQVKLGIWAGEVNSGWRWGGDAAAGTRWWC
jgi:hypothetical protein